MENSSELLTRRNANILNLRKISTLDSTSSSFKPKKLKLRNEITSLLKFNDNTSPKKLDFPVCFSLFTHKKTNENKENSIKREKDSKLNLNLKSIKPKHLNNLNLNDIIKPNNKKIISRNKNYFNSQSKSNLKSKNNPSFTRFISPNKTNTSQLLLNKLNYSPSNILSNKNPIIINQIGLSSPILKFNTKFNNSNSTLEQDISIIKNIKGLSINNLNYNINFNDKKIMPSIFSSPTSFDNLIKKQKIQKDSKKKKIFKMKKKVQNDINNFEDKIDKIKNNYETKDENKTINSFSFENGNNSINKSEINNDNNKEENKSQIFKKNLRKNISNKTFYKSSKKIMYEEKLKDDINLNDKYSSIKNIYRFEYILNNHLENQTQKALNGNKIEDKFEYKLENKKESFKKLENQSLPEKNSIKENINNINNNKAKIARLSRLKKSSLKTGVKQKKRVNINDIKENKTKKEEKDSNKNRKENKDNKENNDKNINRNNNNNNEPKSEENKENKNNNSNNKNEDNNAEISSNRNKKYLSLKTKTNIKKKKSMILEDKNNMERDEIKRSKSSRVIESKIINIFKIKKNKFYLTLNKKKTNNIYEKNKFLKKWNDKLNEIKSKNRIYRQIYVQKTKMLLNTQEKTYNIIANEKSYLEFPENSSIQNINIYFDDLLLKKNKKTKKDENTNITYKAKNKFKCNLCPCIYDSIISIIDFDSFPENITSIKHKKKQNNFIYNRQRRISRKNFKTVKLRRLSLFDFDDNENGDNFSITKTKNNLLKDLEWMYIPINLLSIQEIILRSNNYYYDKRYRLYGRRKRSTRRKLSHSYNNNKNESYDSKKYVRQLSLSKKFSNLNYSQLKKNMRKNWDFSILNQKKFFKRTREKYKKRGGVILSKKELKPFNEDNSSDEYYSDRLSSLEKSSNLEEVYFELMSLILEGKNKQFLKQFEKHKNIININQQLIGGNTLLILCAREGNYTIAKFLCDHRIEVNIQNNAGNTALHYAIGNQFYSIADILTRHGAREDIPNNKGLLPWDCVENNID